MIRVSSITQQVRDLTGGLDTFEVEAATVRAMIGVLDTRFPGLGALISDHMSLAIDGELHQDVLNEVLAPGCEVVLVPRITAG